MKTVNNDCDVKQTSEVEAQSRKFTSGVMMNFTSLGDGDAMAANSDMVSAGGMKLMSKHTRVIVRLNAD